MSFVVRYSESARDDLTRLYAYLLDRATTVDELDLAEQALGAITGAVESLKRSPFIYRTVPGFTVHCVLNSLLRRRS